MAEVHLPHAPHAATDNPEVRHETSDVNIRAILLFAAGLIVAGVLINFGVWLLFEYFSVREARRLRPEYPLAATQQVRLPPEPRLQEHPRQDLEALRAKDQDVLTTYGWVDRNAGVVRIPIDEAMKTVIQRGLPSRPTETK